MQVYHQQGTATRPEESYFANWSVLYLGTNIVPSLQQPKGGSSGRKLDSTKYLESLSRPWHGFKAG